MIPYLLLAIHIISPCCVVEKNPNHHKIFFHFSLWKLGRKIIFKSIILYKKKPISDIEPFVLQAAMGITARALQIAKQLVCIQKAREDVFMQVYAWLIELIQGYLYFK